MLDDSDFFGYSVTAVGDLDGDGITDLAAGAYGDDDGGPRRGAVWVLFMDSDGTVQSEQKISDLSGGFTGVLDDQDFWGISVAALGDLDGDGVEDLAVGAHLDDDGGMDRGAVWILFLNTDGTVKAHQKISDTAGGFGGTLSDADFFGIAVAAIDDLDGDGVCELAVGNYGDDDGGTQRGSVWILFLNTDGTVKAEQKISDTQGGFTGALDDDDLFGGAVASMGDLDGDGIADLAVGAPFDDDGGPDRGAAWILFLDTDGAVQSHQKISDTAGGLTSTLGDGDSFGASLAFFGDLNGDGTTDLASGAFGDDGNGSTRGAVWVLLMNPDGTVLGEQRINDTEGRPGDGLSDDDWFGISVAALGDLDGDGLPDIAAGTRGDDDGGIDRGSVRILFLDNDPSGTVVDYQKISDIEGGFGGTLDDSDFFGYSVARIGDLDADGVDDLAVGAPRDADGASSSGAVWILFLNQDGTVESEQKISATQGGFGGSLDAGDEFGGAISSIGDLDGDGVLDLAVGSPNDDDGGAGRGAVWILFLNQDGTVKSEQKISDTNGNFTGVLDDSDFFGSSLSAIGDLDGDGTTDLAVGAVLDDDGGSSRGAVWILFLNDDGTVSSHQKISAVSGGFGGALSDGDFFGFSLAWDSTTLLVGAPLTDSTAIDSGAVWLLDLDTDGTVSSEAQISSQQGSFSGQLDTADRFGQSVAALGDLDGDGVGDFAAGAYFDDDGGANMQTGAAWILFMAADGTVKDEQKISPTLGSFDGAVDAFDVLGCSMTGLGDLDQDGFPDLAVGAYADDDGGSARGAVWNLFLQGDATAPVVACAANQTVECTSPSGATVVFDSTATDDKDPDPAVVCVPPSGSTFPLGTTAVTCTATDLSGNSAMCSFDVTVEDTTAPLLGCPDDLTVYFGKHAPVEGGPATPVHFSVTATDVCDPSPSVVAVPPSGSVFPWGTTTVTCTATDAEGNSSMCTFDVTVRPRVPGLAGSLGGSIAPLEARGARDSDPSRESRDTAPEPSLLQLQRGASLFGASSQDPIQLVSTSEPWPGRTWRALVDTQGGATTSMLLLSTRPLSGTPTAAGLLRVDTSAPHLLATTTVRDATGRHVHEIEIPRGANVPLYAQAVLFGERITLTNAIRLRVSD